MKNMCVLMFAFLLLGGLTGCGSSATKDQITAVNEMATLLEGIKDDKSAEEALPKLEKAADKARAAGEKVASSKLSEGDATKYAKELGEAQTKMSAAAMKAALAAPGKGKEITAALAKAAPKNVKIP
ncbi:MAG TPA: hypothetical protein VH643_00105 [Gemmataceae bacterium]|jgi:hypothetical protein